MNYYIKGFGQKPLKLSISKTNHPEIDSYPSKIEAIIETMKYCHNTMTDWSKDRNTYGKEIVLEQKIALKQLSDLLKKEIK